MNREQWRDRQAHCRSRVFTSFGHYQCKRMAPDGPCPRDRSDKCPRSKKKAKRTEAAP